MTESGDLSSDEIAFLQTIRDSTGSPAEASLNQGTTPATIPEISSKTTLSEEEVAYRLIHSRLAKRGLLNVSKAGPSDDDSASLHSVELTAAGKRALAEAERRDVTADSREQNPTEAEDASVDGRKPETPAQTKTESTTEDRLAALEARIEELEATNGDESVAGKSTSAALDERSEPLATEIAELRAITERLESRLDDAVSELTRIRESEYGALDEKREQQFETAVKSMVAFHQLATEVLDVRVENYEPAAGRADEERVQRTRNRIRDALGVETSEGGESMALEDVITGSDTDWPEPEAADAGGRLFADDDGLTAESGELTTESDAPESGVYPPIGDDEAGPNDPKSSAPDDVDGQLPESVRPEPESTDANLTESSAPEALTQVGTETGTRRLSSVEPGDLLAVRNAISERSAASDDKTRTADCSAYARFVEDVPADDDGSWTAQSAPLPRVTGHFEIPSCGRSPDSEPVGAPTPGER